MPAKKHAADERLTYLHTIPANQIVQNEALQVREKLHAGKVKDYERAYKSGVVMPPVVVAEVAGEGFESHTYVLLDGWHRLAALERIGQREVSARIIPAEERELEWLAARANLSHGLPLRPRERRAVFRAYVHSGAHRTSEGRPKSYREMAVDLGGTVSYGTVRLWMKADFPRVFQQLSGGSEDDDENAYHTIDASDDRYEDTALDALEKAYSACCAVTHPDARGRLIAHAERNLKALKGRGKWTRFKDEDSPF